MLMLFWGAPWHMTNKILVLKHGQPNMQFSTYDLARVPVWVKFYNVSLEYLTIKMLSSVVSVIGVPLRVELK